VFKLKKPVNFGFLDFSTLPKRQFYCQREVDLNRRLCPDMYLGVVPICQDGKKLSFEERGVCVEYVVKMRELAEAYFIKELLPRGRVGPEHMDKIVSVLTRFYDSQSPTAEIESWGTVEKLKISTDENFSQIEPYIGQVTSRPAFETIRSFTNSFYQQCSHLFESRIREHRIRDCHGDLHLDHIHLTPDSISIFDCIEFNERFRFLDVANDLAFLAMDLDFEGYSALARHFIATAVRQLHDLGMRSVTDFYKCYRACVRGKVETMRSAALEAQPEEQETHLRLARRYFRLALQYAVTGSRPLVLAMMGRIASGKSTLAEALAAELGWALFSSDRMRKTAAGVPLYERGNDIARSELYSTAMTEQTYHNLITAAEAEAEAGRSVVLDATFAKRSHRARLADRLGVRGVAFRFVETEADHDTIKQRLQARDAGPHVVSDARLEDFESLTRLYEPPRELAQGDLIKVGASALPEETLTRVLMALAEAQVEPHRT
jgi:aminoglycoside phosphotransferase family enzyme/predicted kinase